MEVDGRFCLQMNIKSIIYFNCVERYEDIVGHLKKTVVGRALHRYPNFFQALISQLLKLCT